MGSSAEERARFLELAKAARNRWSIDRIPTEGPQHLVRLTRPFYLGKHEVTQGQWEAVMGSNPSSFKGDASHPAEHVSWDDVQPNTPLNGMPLGWPADPDDLFVDDEGQPIRLDKAFSWEHPLSVHGLMQNAITNAWRGDPYSIDTMMILPPPSTAGVTKKPRQSTNTTIIPANRPGSESGKNTCQKARTGPAPRLAAAFIKS